MDGSEVSPGSAMELQQALRHATDVIDCSLDERFELSPLAHSRRILLIYGGYISSSQSKTAPEILCQV